ncbi:MAG TPA: hypothetical protein VGC18_09840 [Lacisediminihabitans sp.]|uniref:hypothetical protein n=1 Tax=Lacisediminihabitans sp. TaxID=2787631 RepID=UPI002ED8831F
MARAESWRVSPQEVDPLSWFSGPLVPGVFAGIIAAYGVIASLVTRGTAPAPGLELVAIVLFVGCGIAILTLTRPRRPHLRTWQAMLVLLVAWLALLASAADLAPGSVPVEQWWATCGLALVIASLGPYSSALQVLLYGVLSTIVAGAVLWVGFVSTESFWPPITVLLIGTGPIVVATASMTVFSYTVVTLVLRSLDAPQDEIVDPAVGRFQGSTLPALIERAIPLLEEWAASGEIKAQHRSMAARLAEAVRLDLVTRSRLSWLQALVDDLPVEVIDPERRADRMLQPQKAALRGLLLAVLRTPPLDRGRLRVEFVPQGESTRVLLHSDIEVSGTGRMTALAPYYITLGTTVPNLVWHDGRQFSMEFDLPPEG